MPIMGFLDGAIVGRLTTRSRHNKRFSRGCRMSFDDLPPLPPLIRPEGDRYVERIMALGRAAQKKTRCILDLSYGSDYWQRLDVYLPADRAGGALPVLC